MRGRGLFAPRGGPIGRSSWRAKLALLGLGMVVGLVLCELTARAIYAVPPEPAREPQIVYRREADVGFLHLPNQAGWIDDGFVTINDLGLRGAAPARPKPPAAFRVLATGDSTTVGWGVHDADTYPAQLETRLRASFPDLRVDVVNGGVSGYDLEQQARLIRRLVPILQPDVLLVGFFWNDLPYRHVSPEGEPAGIEPSHSLDRPHTPGTFRLGNRPSRLNRVLRSSRLLYVLRHAWLDLTSSGPSAANDVRWELALLEGRQSDAIDHAWSQTRDVLSSIQALAAEHAIPLALVVIPVRAQVERDYPRAAYQVRVQALAESLGVPVLDPLPRFVSQRSRRRLFIPFDRMHFSAAGNQLIAETAFDALRTSIEHYSRTRRVETSGPHAPGRGDASHRP